jgi:hypothetical protein
MDASLIIAILYTLDNSVKWRMARLSHNAAAVRSAEARRDRGAIPPALATPDIWSKGSHRKRWPSLGEARFWSARCRITNRKQ